MITPIQHTGKYKNFITKWKTLRRIRNVLTGFHVFKQNRTEKMSMAQYQIYVSKLWSEICQKVGYMNIVDYDNFGDIKSIFYDLEKRHLIKKENDGIE